jgi:subtilisin-like proprotein convertase family protein
MTLFASLGINAAEATTYGTLYSIEEMTDLAHDVISGTVTHLESKQVDGVIKTSVTVNIEHNFVGSKSQSFTFDIIGGTVNGITMDVPGAPKFEQGQSVLLFLDQKQVVGFGQGLYAIGPDKTATRSMEGTAVLDENTPAPNTLDLELDLPDEEKARSCLEVKVWDNYDDEWTLRTAEVDHLAHGEFKSYPVTLLGDMEYEFLTCTDDKSDAIQLTLYDDRGEILSTTSELGREALLVYQSKRSQTVFVSIQVEIDNPDVKQVGTSLGVLYR